VHGNTRRAFGLSSSENLDNFDDLIAQFTCLEAHARGPMEKSITSSPFVYE
jgi:hypothetical protein